MKKPLNHEFIKIKEPSAKGQEKMTPGMRALQLLHPDIKNGASFPPVIDSDREEMLRGVVEKLVEDKRKHKIGPQRIDGGESLIYADQEPQLRDFGDHKMLSFHEKGERYVLKSGEPLVIYKDGVIVETAPKHFISLGVAVHELNNPEITSFYETHIKE